MKEYEMDEKALREKVDRILNGGQPFPADWLTVEAVSPIVHRKAYTEDYPTREDTDRFMAWLDGYVGTARIMDIVWKECVHSSAHVLLGRLEEAYAVWLEEFLPHRCIDLQCRYMDAKERAMKEQREEEE